MKSPDDSFKFTPASEPTWNRMNQANVVANVSKGFPMRDEFDGGSSDVSSVTSSKAFTNPDSLDTNDAQKLANVLQQQLDAINDELA